MENLNKPELELKAKKIIADLILLEPDLKGIESDLNKLVLEFIKNKPEPVLDKNFEQELKSLIKTKIRELKNNYMEEKNEFKKGVFLKKLSFSFGAIVLALIIVLPTVNFIKNKNQVARVTPTEIINDSAEVKITRLENRAFGEINFENNGGPNNESLASSMMGDSEVAVQEGMAYREEAPISDGDASSPVLGMGSASSAGMGGFTDAPDMRIMPYPDYEYPTFTYVYEGSDLENIVGDLDKVDVYKRKKVENNDSSLLNLATNLASDLINLKKFNNNTTRVSNFSLNENRDFGYVVGFDGTNGSVSLYQNWYKWPQDHTLCYDEACILRNQFKYNDLLANEDAIKIAENFLEEYSIKRSIYGEPVVNYNFHEIYAKAQDKTSLYVPEETTIIFPFVIDGKEIKDEGGQAYGLYVNVSSRHKKVTGLNNLLPANYEVSSYEAFNDVSEIKRLAEQGGVYSYKDPYATKEITVYLGEPELILSRQYQYSDNYENSAELFVPALSFPVLRLSEETNYFYQKNIVIPLVKELIKENRGGVEIMPYPAIDMAR